MKRKIPVELSSSFYIYIYIYIYISSGGNLRPCLGVLLLAE